jgi:hypothetical protein
VCGSDLHNDYIFIFLSERHLSNIFLENEIISGLYDRIQPTTLVLWILVIVIFFFNFIRKRPQGLALIKAKIRLGVPVLQEERKHTNY